MIKTQISYPYQGQQHPSDLRWYGRGSMAEYKMVFKRYEMKYLLDEDQRDRIYEILDSHMAIDQYGHSEIRNVYYDTDSFRLIRRSIEKPLYKEKLRFRSYGRPKKDGKIFVELKKKYDGVVYKRRLTMPLDEATRWLADEDAVPPEGQIGAEIDFFKHRYEGLGPAMSVFYEREAYTPKDGSDLRVTIDTNIRSSLEDVSLRADGPEHVVLPEGYTLMELKTMGGIPLWMVDVLSRNRTYRASFSKYGNAYKQMVLQKEPEFYSALRMDRTVCPSPYP